MEKMKALVVEGAGQLIYRDVARPQIKADEVLVKVRACGICGSDMARVKDGEVHSTPIIIGHEFSGDIAQIGESVTNCAVGDRVAAAPLIPCCRCENCEKGEPAMCTRYSFIGSRQNGAMAEYVAVPSRNIILLAEHVTYEQGACIEPLTVAIHGVERASLQSGAAAIVYGCGTIGNLVMQCIKAKGIEKVYAIDIDAHKLALAKKLGAYETLDASKVNVQEYFAAHGKVDYVFETAGVNMIQSDVLSLAKKSGSIVYIGTAHKDVTIPAKNFELILRGELQVTGSWMSYSAPFPGGEWRGAAEYLAAGKVNVDALITHRFALQDGYKAIEAMRNKAENALKVMYFL